MAELQRWDGDEAGELYVTHDDDECVRRATQPLIPVISKQAPGTRHRSSLPLSATRPGTMEWTTSIVKAPLHWGKGVSRPVRKGPPIAGAPTGRGSTCVAPEQ
ncbi:hypothetical protein KC19_11G000600, partial [Ceratodon purpureus]